MHIATRSQHATTLQHTNASQPALRNQRAMRNAQSLPPPSSPSRHEFHESPSAHITPTRRFFSSQTAFGCPQTLGGRRHEGSHAQRVLSMGLNSCKCRSKVPRAARCPFAEAGE
eukprot:10967723-Alexandrium_andersonii.AAC.1